MSRGRFADSIAAPGVVPTLFRWSSEDERNSGRQLITEGTIDGGCELGVEMQLCARPHLPPVIPVEKTNEPLGGEGPRA